MHLLATLNRLARERNQEFVVIGALAVIHHGYPRESNDVDLLIRKTGRGDWLDLLASLNYTLVRDGDVFVQFDPPSDGSWPVDLMLVNDETFGQIRSGSVEVEFAATAARIPSVEHLLALKLHALKHGRMHRFLKDLIDVEGIVRKNRLDLASEKIRQLFLKYGTLEIYEKVVRACSDA